MFILNQFETAQRGWQQIEEQTESVSDTYHERTGRIQTKQTCMMWFFIDTRRCSQPTCSNLRRLQFEKSLVIAGFLGKGFEASSDYQGNL